MTAGSDMVSSIISYSWEDDVKAKLSVTLDTALVDFVDALPGASRSAKIEQVLRGFKTIIDDQKLRRALAKATESDDERLEREAWVKTMERDQWTLSDGATSGRSRS